MLTISVLSFVSRCSHLSCRSRHFDCLLLVFFSRWGRLVTQYHLYHAGWLWLVHFVPHCSGEKLFPQWSVVVPFSCCVSWSWASTLREFQFAIPVGVIRVKSYVNSFLDPSGVPVRVSINKLYLVPQGVVAGLVGVLRNGGGLGAGESYIPVVFFDSLMHRSSCFPDIDFPHSQGIL